MCKDPALRVFTLGDEHKRSGQGLLPRVCRIRGRESFVQRFGVWGVRLP